MAIRINRVYTRTGDDGKTALVGGKRVSKCDPRIEAYGDVDELNSVIWKRGARVRDELLGRVRRHHGSRVPNLEYP